MSMPDTRPKIRRALHSLVKSGSITARCDRCKGRLTLANLRKYTCPTCGKLEWGSVRYRSATSWDRLIADSADEIG